MRTGMAGCASSQGASVRPLWGGPGAQVMLGLSLRLPLTHSGGQQSHQGEMANAGLGSCCQQVQETCVAPEVERGQHQVGMSKR